MQSRETVNLSDGNSADEALNTVSDKLRLSCSDNEDLLG